AGQTEIELEDVRRMGLRGTGNDQTREHAEEAAHDDLPNDGTVPRRSGRVKGPRRKTPQGVALLPAVPGLLARLIVPSRLVVRRLRDHAGRVGELPRGVVEHHAADGDARTFRGLQADARAELVVAPLRAAGAVGRERYVTRGGQGENGKAGPAHGPMIAQTRRGDQRPALR